MSYGRSYSGENGDEKKLFRIEEVAQRCGVSKRTVYRWIGSEHLPTHALPGSGRAKMLRIDSDDLETWLAMFRHDVADDRDGDSQKLCLEGRRFIKGAKSSAASKSGLDSRSVPASRVLGTAEGRS